MNPLRSVLRTKSDCVPETGDCCRKTDGFSTPDREGGREGERERGLRIKNLPSNRPKTNTRRGQGTVAEEISGAPGQEGVRIKDQEILVEETSLSFQLTSHISSVPSHAFCRRSVVLLSHSKIA